jgi:pyruvate formate lyase activating enzyme
VSPEMPLHISRYFPAYKYHEEPTDAGLIRRFLGIAREKLKYVYAGNI